jgi:hypothetical protein
MKMSSYQRAEFFAKKVLNLDAGNETAKRFLNMMAVSHYNFQLTREASNN